MLLARHEDQTRPRPDQLRSSHQANFKATARQTAILFAEALEGVVRPMADEVAEALLLLMLVSFHG